MRISDWSSDVCSSDLLIERAGLPSSPRWLRQVHGTAVVRFGAALSETHPHPGPPLEGEGARAGAGAEPEADAAVTSTPGVVLAILTADCLPVVFAARDGSEIGRAHV